MSHSSYVVTSRANMLARIVLVIDLLLVVAIYISETPAVWLAAPAVAAVLLFPYLRYVSRSPALWTLGMLTLSAASLALAGPLLGATGVALGALAAAPGIGWFWVGPAQVRPADGRDTRLEPWPSLRSC